MALFDILIWFFVGGIIGGSVGVGVSRLALYYQKRKDEKKVFEIIEGKAKNTFKLEGKMINVNKFTYKEDNGEIIKKVTLTDIVEKNQPQSLKEGNKGFFWRFWIKKDIGEKKRK